MVREEHGVKQNNTNIPKNRISYSYNSSGNRIKCQNTDFENSSNSRVTDYTYDSANRLTSKSETSANSTSNSVYTYDLSGNLLTGTTTEISGNSQTTHSSTYSYDSLNRTSSVTKDGVTSDYAYDENNRRISKSVDTGTTLYYWNNDQMLCEFNSDNVSQCNYYVWGIGNEAEGMMKNGIPYSNMLNLTGDIVCTIGQTNQTEIETQYDAYGNILSGSTLLYYAFLSPQQYKNAGEIIEQLLPHISDISYRTYYRKRRDAISSLSCILWGYTERESLEVTKKFLQDK